MEKCHQYHFLNNINGFSFNLIKGRALIHEIDAIHNIGPHAKDFYNKTVLSSMQMVNFLKPQESLGFYIDSEEPYYRFKVEMSAEGMMRTLLLPEEFQDYPKNFTGKCRIHKTIVGKSPYTSVLEFKNLELDEIINQVMEKSYQTNSKILMSEDKESSLMLTLLPPTNVDIKFEELNPLTIEKALLKFQGFFKDILNNDYSQSELEIKAKEQESLFLGSKEITFHCPCSKERMVENLYTLSEDDRQHVFAENDPVEVRCDYCNTVYHIGSGDLGTVQ